MTSNFSTLNSQQFPDPTKGLNNLSDLLAVLEELEIEENSEQWNTLLDTKRYLMSTTNVELKLNARDAKLKPCKLYYFNDVFIIGQYKKSKNRKNTMNTLKSKGSNEQIVFGKLIGRKASDLSEEAFEADAKNTDGNSVQNTDTGTMKSARQSVGSFNDGQKLRIKLWMDLDHVDVKSIQEEGEFGVRCFCSIQTIREDEETGDSVFVTEVQQVQMFFIDKAERDTVFENLVQAIDHVLEEQMTASKSSDSQNFDETSTIADAKSVKPEVVDDSDSDGNSEPDLTQKTMKRLVKGNKEGHVNRSKSMHSVQSEDSVDSNQTGVTNKSKRRGYAKGKDTMRKMKSNRNKKKVSGLNTLSSVHSEEEAPLTLDDLVEKYKVILGPDQEDQEATFSVSFGYGSMGFALSSTRTEKDGGFGVFVGRLEAGGMAEAGGVTLGDRIVKIGDIEITAAMSWQDCIELIKQKKNEKDSNGKPKNLDMTFSRARSVEDNVSKKVEEQKRREIKERIKKRGGKRAWTKRKQKSFGSRMATLDDIKSLYEKGNANDIKQETCDKLFDMMLAKKGMSDAEKKCVHILREIHDSEKSYLSSLYTLVDKYQKPLTKKRIEVQCKELPVSVTKFCEHKIPKLTCPQMSSQKVHIITKAEAKAIFGNVELLTKVNENLMGALQDGLVKLLQKYESSEEEFTVTDVVLIFAPVFVTIMPFFKMYSQYAFQYSNALETVNMMKEKDEFRHELQRIEGKKDTESLNSLLIKPISRLCKYPLLFDNLTSSMRPYIQELASNAVKSGKGNIDKLDRCVTELMEATRMVSNIAESVDLKVGENHDLEKLSDIYQELGGHHGVKQFMLPSRRFVGKYDCFIEDKARKQKTKAFVIYLFNDLVIFAQEKKATGILAQLDKLSTKKKGTFDSLNGTVKPGKLDDAKSRLSRGSKNSKTSNALTKVAGALASRNNSLNRMAAKQLVYVKKQMKVEQVNVRPKSVENKEGMFGISFTETERKSKQAKAKKAKEDEVAKPDVEETETYVSRYDVWCVTKEDRDELLKAINDQVTKHKDNIRNKHKAEAMLKPEMKKRQRAWKAKAHERRKQKESVSLEELAVEQKQKRKSQFVQMDISQAQ